MVGALKDLGIKLAEDWSNDKIIVHGCAGKFPMENAQLYLGNAGTAMRYFGPLNLKLLGSEQSCSNNSCLNLSGAMCLPPYPCSLFPVPHYLCRLAIGLVQAQS